MSSWPHTFATQYPSIALSWLDDQFNQISSTATTTVSAAGANLIGYTWGGISSVGSIAARLNQSVSVKDPPFSAGGQGSTDDSTAFQTVGNLGAFKTVMVPGGTYSLGVTPSFTATHVPTFIITDGASFTGTGTLSGYHLWFSTGSYLPVGNALATLSPFYAYGGCQSETVREYIAAVGLVADKGSTQTNSGSGDKTGLYIGAEAAVGGGNVWAFNPLATIDSGWTGTTGSVGINQNVQIAEFDLNNNNAHYGDTGSIAYGNPSGTGILITGAGSFRCNGAIQILGNITGATPMWNFGMWIGNNSIVRYTVLDDSNAPTSLMIAGSHTYAMDTQQGTFSGPVIRMGNGQTIAFRNGTNSADITFGRIDSSNNVTLGDSAAGLFSAVNFAPNVDNSFTCGQSGARWSAVWAVNGTIQTSDPKLKKDISDLPSMLPVVQSISPKTYKWIVGGMVSKEVEEEKEVQEVDVTYGDKVELRDGKPILVKGVQRIETPLFDHVQVIDENGEPVWRIENRKTGSVRVPVTHAVPRMVKKNVTTSKMVERPGSRTHWGFLAPDIKSAFDKIGMDFGGYVKGEDGTEALRQDQLIAVLWKAVQELAKEVETLKAK